MKTSHKKLVGLLILLLFLVPLGIAVKKVYRENQQPELNRALIAAVKKNDTAAVVALLAQGADANARDVSPDTRSVWLRLRDRFAGKPHPTEYGPTVLILALVWDDDFKFLPENVPLVKALLDAGSDVRAVDQADRMALMWATMSGKRNTIQLLLDRGADVIHLDTYGFTALHRAATCGDSSVTQLLIERGADVNARNDYRETPLLIAAEDGQTSNVRLMLENGGDVNVRDDNGKTPLSAAISYDNVECVKLLLASGASVHTIDNNRMTPLKIAQKHHETQIIKMLKQVGARK